MAKEPPIKTMIVGLGRIGWDFHIKQAATNPHFAVAAAVDTVPARRREAAETYGCPAFARLEDALDAGLAELAVISTRTVDHCAHTLAALKAGCHVLVEKPAGMSAAEMDRMMRAARSARKILTVHQSWRMEKEPRFIREVIDSGILGRVFEIRLSLSQYWRRSDWQTVKRFGGGVLRNGGSHLVDTMLRLLDSPVARACGYINHTVTAGDADDFNAMLIVGRNKRVLEIEQSWGNALPEFAFLVCGTTGAMQVRDQKATIRYFDPKDVTPVKLSTAVPEDRKYRNVDRLPWQEKTVPVEPEKPYPDFYESLYRSIRKRARLLVTPESVREALRVLDQVRKSAG
jgi:predicted dehydrogenase